jgi:hypothetical protein
MILHDAIRARCYLPGIKENRLPRKRTISMNPH